jgi:hypothetical protein
LVVEDELTYLQRELVSLPLTLDAPRRIGFAFRRGSTHGLDRVRGRAELMRGDMCDGSGLARRICGVPGMPA